MVTGGSVADFAILNNPNTALLGIGIAALWKQVPLTTLLLLAGLQSVPSDMLEAATVDGASALRRFVSIVIPYMMSVIKVTVSMSIIENFKQFPLFWTMTGGGPDGATTTLAILELPRSLRLQRPGQRRRRYHGVDAADDPGGLCLQQDLQSGTHGLRKGGAR